MAVVERVAEGDGLGLISSFCSGRSSSTGEGARRLEEEEEEEEDDDDDDEDDEDDESGVELCGAYGTRSIASGFRSAEAAAND